MRDRAQQRDHRARRLDEFRDRQAADGWAWVPLRDVAPKLGAAPGEGMVLLLRRIRAGFFDQDLLLLHPEPGARWGRLPPGQLGWLPTERDQLELLTHCWVRQEAVRRLLQAYQPDVGELEPAAPKPAARASYGRQALLWWFGSRVTGWPKGKPGPSEAADLAAAEAYFDCSIPRDAFRVIRRNVLQNHRPEWLKPGPKTGSKTRQRRN